MTRILVTGSREWPGTWEDIAAHFPERGDVTIIHGACSRKVRKGYGTRGFCTVEVSVDTLADFAARGLGFSVEAYPVDHQLDGPWPAAGPRRNARMLRESKPDRGLAFGALWKDLVTRRALKLKHSGTGDMVAKMLNARLPVRWVPAPGADAVDLVTMPAPPVSP